MLSHVRLFLENEWLMIDKRFTLLLNALHQCADVEGHVRKDFPGNDVFDCLRESLTCYGDFTW
jgi:hypothetical protein